MATEKPVMIERQQSVISMLSAGLDSCRICQCDSSCGELISPCYCSGSLQWVHQVCLQHWIRASGNKACELCRYPYSMRSKMRPICEWEALPMSGSEKRRFYCSALFHSIALGCVVWSLYVLIGMLNILTLALIMMERCDRHVLTLNSIAILLSNRTVLELQDATLEWQFWTKIIVEAIGCIGAGLLFYVWGKTYFSVVTKWIAFNRTFLIVSSSPVPVKRLSSTINVSSSSPSGATTEVDSTLDKGREAKALLLPPVEYSPPDSGCIDTC